MYPMQYRIILVICFMLFLTACGGEAETAPPTPTLESMAAAGQTIFRRDCSACHALEPDTIIVGPSLAGIADRAATRIDGQDSTDYLLNSVLAPSDFVVDGFDDAMPNTFGKSLTGEELDSLIAYLLTLK